MFKMIAHIKPAASFKQASCLAPLNYSHALVPDHLVTGTSATANDYQATGFANPSLATAGIAIEAKMFSPT